MLISLSLALFNKERQIRSPFSILLTTIQSSFPLFYRLQAKLQEGNVLTHACQSFCSQGLRGVRMSFLVMDSIPVGWHPSRMAPPRWYHLGWHPPGTAASPGQPPPGWHPHCSQQAGPTGMLSCFKKNCWTHVLLWGH